MSMFTFTSHAPHSLQFILLGVSSAFFGISTALIFQYPHRWMMNRAPQLRDAQILLEGTAYGLPGAYLTLHPEELRCTRQKVSFKFVSETIGLNTIKSLKSGRRLFFAVIVLEIEFYDGGVRRLYVQQAKLWIEAFEQLRSALQISS